MGVLLDHALAGSEECSFCGQYGFSQKDHWFVIQTSDASGPRLKIRICGLRTLDSILERTKNTLSPGDFISGFYFPTVMQPNVRTALVAQFNPIDFEVATSTDSISTTNSASNWKQEGRCLVCGDYGEWIRMGLFCKQGHGKICG